MFMYFYFLIPHLHSQWWLYLTVATLSRYGCWAPCIKDPTRIKDIVNRMARNPDAGSLLMICFVLFLFILFFACYSWPRYILYKVVMNNSPYPPPLILFSFPLLTLILIYILVLPFLLSVMCSYGVLCCIQCLRYLYYVCVVLSTLVPCSGFDP